MYTLPMLYVRIRSLQDQAEDFTQEAKAVRGPLHGLDTYSVTAATRAPTSVALHTEFNQTGDLIDANPR